jgi:hypothetical protein
VRYNQTFVPIGTSAQYFNGNKAYCIRVEAPDFGPATMTARYRGFGCRIQATAAKPQKLFLECHPELSEDLLLLKAKQILRPRIKSAAAGWHLLLFLQQPLKHTLFYVSDFAGLTLVK